MIFLLYGPNLYTKKRNLDELRLSLRNKYKDLAEKRFHLDDGEQEEEFIEFISLSNLFENGKKIALISQIDKAKNQEKLSSILKSNENSDKTAIFITEDWEKKEFTKKIEGLLGGLKIKEQFFGKLPPEKAWEYFSKEIKIKIDRETFIFIYEYLNNDLFATINEIEKLSFGNKDINLELIKSLPEYRKNINVFDFAKTIIYNESMAKKLLFWEIALTQKIDLFGIFNYLAKASSKEKLIKDLAEKDVKIKSGLLDPDQAILEIILN